MPFYTIHELIKGYKAGKFSVTQIIGEYISHIEKYEPKVNALITLVDKELLLKKAKECDEELNANIKNNSVSKLYESKPLFGVPVIHKDMFLTKGIRTTAASKVLDNFIPVYNATVVEKLEKAGAIILGKANQDAWAHGSSGENSDYGFTRNPWHADYVPGGSSSGSAAAVMAGFAPLSTATDTGGSVRQPASLTGTVGLKPTYGRVSRYGVVAMASSLDSIGHFTLDVLDNAYVLGITAGKDLNDATTSDLPVPDYYGSLLKFKGPEHKDWLKGYKIGILIDAFKEGVDSKVADLVYKQAEKLRGFGAEVVEFSLPEIKYGLPLYYIIQTAEVASNLARYTGVRYGHDRSYFSDEAKRRIMLGNYILSDVVEGKQEATTYFKAAEGKALLIKKFKEAFSKLDAIVMPVSPTLPFKIGSKTSDPLQMYMSDLLTVPVNIAGIPGISLNAGFVNVEDYVLPVGMQVVTDFFEELKMYKVAIALESVSINIVDMFSEHGFVGFKDVEPIDSHKSHSK